MGLFDSFSGFANSVGDALGGVVNFLGENIDEIQSVAEGVKGLTGANKGPGTSAGNKPSGKKKPPIGSSLTTQTQAGGGLATGTLLLFVGALAIVVLIAKR